MDNQNISRESILNLYTQQLAKETLLNRQLEQAEEVEEIDPLLLANIKSAEKSPFSRDMVILSPAAQRFLQFLRENFPIDPYIFLHVNYIKTVSFGKSINVVVDKLTKGYRMIFALSNKNK
ncbi:MAG: hypothetical protein RMJ51_02730 [Candidatus Calescibacterium sp.]|nr:hypothetical protein [Candidatus Calescibacterium sp.]MCX7972256.1 hypothetical protein [bacterium]MDW8195142.1 hypothetical protein [Candidatus Calescibacterium sp.]